MRVIKRFDLKKGTMVVAKKGKYILATDMHDAVKLCLFQDKLLKKVGRVLKAHGLLKKT